MSPDRKTHNHRGQKPSKQWNWRLGTTKTHCPCHIRHDLISCFPQRERAQKVNHGCNQEEAFSWRLWHILWNTAQVKQKIRVVLPEAMHNTKLSLCNVIIFPPASLLHCLVIHAPHCVEITWFSLTYCEMPRLGFADTFALFSWKPRATRQHKSHQLI